MPGKEREIVSRRLGRKTRIRVGRLVIRARVVNGETHVIVSEIPPDVIVEHDSALDDEYPTTVV